MARASCTVWFEATAHLSGQASRTDYGVPGSPTFDEFLEQELDVIEIFGKAYTKAQLEGKTAWDFLEAGAIELADDWQRD
jgi:hypothetical protein